MLDAEKTYARPIRNPIRRGNSVMMQGGSETRPLNAYVMYCIFTGHAPLPAQVKFFAS